MCGYCGCRAITVIGQLSAGHEQIVNLTGDLRRAVDTADTAAVRGAVTTLRAALDPHTSTEEHGLFAELRRDGDFTDHVDGLCGEHHDLDARLDRLADGDLSGFPAFETLLRRHIDREENGLFPAAAIALDGPAWERVTALTGIS
jgi:hemerythrin-like domain-containing protein